MPAFILASTQHGPLIVNRNDYAQSDEKTFFGVGHQLLVHGCFDPDEVALLKEVLRYRRQFRGDGVFAVDCGANIGVHTVEWARLMTGWGQVLSFEAQQRVFYALAGNVALNNCHNATLMHAAVGDRDGTLDIPFLDPDKPTSFGSLELIKLQKTEQIGQFVNYEKRVAVKMVTLDGLDLPRVDLIKIDVEGMEELVLDGAKDLIERDNPIVYYEILKSDRLSLERFFLSREYSIHYFGNNALALHNSEKLTIEVRQP